MQRCLRFIPVPAFNGWTWGAKMRINYIEFDARTPKVAIAALFAALLATPATAAPVYLQCLIVRENGQHQVDITADEASSQVTVFLPHSGHNERLNAVFSPREVKFANEIVSYTLNRIDLSISLYIKIFRETEAGRCEVQAPPKRAF